MNNVVMLTVIYAFLLSVASKLYVLNVVMLSVFMLGVIRLSVVWLSVIRLSVSTLNVIMLNVVAPLDIMKLTKHSAE
jgi:hypothetical protein